MFDKHTILLVDDEENILNSIYRLLRREKSYEILMAKSGAEGLEILEKRVSSLKSQVPSFEDPTCNLQPASCNAPVSLIVSDQRMPVMEGVEFLSRAKGISPDTTRIMLTGYADINAVTAAVNKGEIFRYITKPWEDETLLSVIRQGIEQYEIITERKALLELTKSQNEELKDLNQNLEKKVDERTREVQELYKELKSNFYETIRVFVNMVEHYDFHLGGHIKRVSILAENFAKFLGLSEKEVEEMEIAALLHDIGLVGIPKIIIAKEMEDLSQNELALVKQHPEFAQSIISSIKNLRQVGVIIKSHHERYDGSGYPDGLRGEEVPYSSRILAVCDTYDDIVHQRTNKDKGGEGAALYVIKNNRSVLFDPEIANAFLKFMSHSKQGGDVAEREVSLSGLEAGMITTRDVVTKGEKMLVSKGVIMTAQLIERLKSFHMIDPILNNIYVKE